MDRVIQRVYVMEHRQMADRVYRPHTEGIYGTEGIERSHNEWAG